LLPGHPEQHVRPRSIRITPEEWQAMLQAARDDVRRIVANHEADGRDFLDDQPKEIERGLFYLGKIEGVGIYCLQASEQLILFNAAGGAKFADLVRSRFETLEIAGDPDVLVLGTDSPNLAAAVSSLGDMTNIVCPKAMSDSLRSEVKQTIVNAEDWPGAAAANIDVISLASAVAYQLNVDGKDVLITPDAPQNLALIWRNPETGKKTFGPMEPQSTELKTKLGASNEFVITYAGWIH
jgi:hypothetical protein